MSVVNTFDSPRCCSGNCSPASNKKVIATETPTPGSSVGNTIAANNAPKIIFNVNQKLLLFKVLNNGNNVVGTLDHPIGTIGTEFQFTPSGLVVVGVMEAFIWVKDVAKGRIGCVRKLNFSWNVSS